MLKRAKGAYGKRGESTRGLINEADEDGGV
jgi:hypothetical protein